jgi:hypothetical protein
MYVLVHVQQDIQDHSVKHIIHVTITNVKMEELHNQMETNVIVSAQQATLDHSVKHIIHVTITNVKMEELQFQ